MIPKGASPAEVVGARGGRKVTWTAPDASGNNETDAGSTDAHDAVAPRTATLNWSTTGPEFLIWTSSDTSPPASTLRFAADSEINDPTARVYRRYITVDSQFRASATSLTCCVGGLATTTRSFRRDRERLAAMCRCAW